VERGIARRLAADRLYAGLITKNPVHPYWRVEWRRDEPYTLAELAGWLFFEDMRPDPTIEVTFGAGRNVTVFDELRQIAYREVLTFACWFQRSMVDRCLRLAIGISQQFPQAMRLSEVGHCQIDIEVAWRHFSEQQFSQRQSRRSGAAAKRWAGHVAESKTEPWKATGISRSTHYRRNTGAASVETCRGKRQKRAHLLPQKATLPGGGKSETIAISDNSPFLRALTSTSGKVQRQRPRSGGRMLTLKQSVKLK
jgi:hypothetical protein